MKKAGTSIFRPRARLIKTLGEELISSDIVGVIELVKNSYDADAEVVEISIAGDVVTRPDPDAKGKKKKSQPEKYIRREGASMVVWDSGCGMSLDTILKAWMEPATISKKTNKFSHSKTRKFTGEKGIGRFATAKIASRLEMITQTRGGDRIVVNFDWSDFGDDSYLDEVKCKWEVFKGKDGESGTTLKLYDLREDWTEDKIKELRLALSRLINPVSPVEEFLIDLKLPGELKHLEGDIKPSEVFSNPRYSIKGFVSEVGKANIAYVGGDGLEESFQLSIMLRNPVRSPSCGPFKFDIRVWDLDKDGLTPLSEKLDMKISKLKKELKQLSGINVYRDNFRVFPYGESGNDWLRLDQRRVNNTIGNKVQRGY